MLSGIEKILGDLQRFAILNKQSITRLFQGFEAAVIIFWVIGAFLLFSDLRGYLGLLYEVGQKMGAAALLFYCTTLLPGIITRTQWLPKITLPIGAMITPFRRHFGISMFLLAFSHMGFTTTLPLLSLGKFTTSALTAEPAKLMGFLAFAVLFPLWLTSNDYSMKKLGKTWKSLHRLTYIALFLIFAHVALFRKNWALVMGVMISIWIISWVRFYNRRRTISSTV